MNSSVNIPLPRNIHCSFIGKEHIELSTITYLPKTYETSSQVFYSKGKASRRYIRTTFNIPTATPISLIFNTANTAFKRNTKALRINIAEHKLYIQEQHLKSLMAIK